MPSTLTNESVVTLRPGTKVRVTANTCGHAYVVGNIYFLYRLSTRNWILSNTATPLMDAGGGYVTYRDIELVASSRNEVIRELKKELKKTEEKMVKLAHDLEVATKYKNELDELADAITTALTDALKTKKLTSGVMYKILADLGVDEHIERKPQAKAA